MEDKEDKAGTFHYVVSTEFQSTENQRNDVTQKLPSDEGRQMTSNSVKASALSSEACLPDVAKSSSGRELSRVVHRLMILVIVLAIVSMTALVLTLLLFTGVLKSKNNAPSNESTNREKMQSVQDIKADMADLQGTLEKSVQKVKVQFEKEIEELKTRLVQLESGNQKIKDWYNRSQHKVNQLERHFQWQRANSSGSNLSHFEMDMKKLWTEAKKTETHFTGIHQQFAGLSTKLNVTTQRLQDAFSRELKSINVTLSTQIDKVTKIPRPVGPPGYINGSQGSGESRDFSQCRHGFAESTKVSSGSSADSVATVIEATGKRIVGATCSTDDAEVSRLRSFEVLSGSNKGKQGYKCDCAGQATVRKSSDGKMTCFIHYWECPLVA